MTPALTSVCRPCTRRPQLQGPGGADADAADAADAGPPFGGSQGGGLGALRHPDQQQQQLRQPHPHHHHQQQQQEQQQQEEEEESRFGRDPAAELRADIAAFLDGEMAQRAARMDKARGRGAQWEGGRACMAGRRALWGRPRARRAHGTPCGAHAGRMRRARGGGGAHRPGPAAAEPHARALPP
jgi:hypothetical protein